MQIFESGQSKINTYLVGLFFTQAVSWGRVLRKMKFWSPYCWAHFESVCSLGCKSALLYWLKQDYRHIRPWRYRYFGCTHTLCCTEAPVNQTLSGKLQSALRELLCCSTSRTVQRVVRSAMDQCPLMFAAQGVLRWSKPFAWGSSNTWLCQPDEERGSENLLSHIGASRFNLWGQKL